jgi:hypothetical protein
MPAIQAQASLAMNRNFFSSFSESVANQVHPFDSGFAWEWTSHAQRDGKSGHTYRGAQLGMSVTIRPSSMRSAILRLMHASAPIEKAGKRLAVFNAVWKDQSPVQESDREAERPARPSVRPAG